MTETPCPHPLVCRARTHRTESARAECATRGREAAKNPARPRALSLVPPPAPSFTPAVDEAEEGPIEKALTKRSHGDYLDEFETVREFTDLSGDSSFQKYHYLITVNLTEEDPDRTELSASIAKLEDTGRLFPGRVAHELVLPLSGTTVSIDAALHSVGVSDISAAFTQAGLPHSRLIVKRRPVDSFEEIDEIFQGNEARQEKHRAEQAKLRSTPEEWAAEGFTENDREIFAYIDVARKARASGIDAHEFRASLHGMMNGQLRRIQLGLSNEVKGIRMRADEIVDSFLSDTEGIRSRVPDLSLSEAVEWRSLYPTTDSAAIAEMIRGGVALADARPFS